MKNITTSALLLFLVFSFFSCNNEKKEYTKFSDKNELDRPKDYREWIFAGTATTPADLNPGMTGFSDFQNIYIDPISFSFWKEYGYFKEGTVLVKEVIAAAEEMDFPIGKTYSQGKVLRLSAMVKDTVRFPNVPGGWEYFTYTNKDGTFKKKSEPVGDKGCIECHKLSKAGSGPFYEHHAPLRDAKGFGKGSPENLDDRSVLPSEKIRLLRDVKKDSI